MHHADPIIDNVRNKVIPSRTNSFHPPNDTAAMAAAVAEVDGGTRKEGSTHQLNTPGNHNGKKKAKKNQKNQKSIIIYRTILTIVKIETVHMQAYYLEAREDHGP